MIRLLTAAAMVASAQAAWRTSPQGAFASDSNWSLDKGRSDQMNTAALNKFKWHKAFYETNSCTTSQETAGTCTPSWYGQAPTVINPSAIGFDSSGEKSTTIKTGPSTATALFTAANTNVEGTDSECNCEYADYHTGLIKSRKLNRGGIIEVELKTTGNADLITSVWAQSDNLEMNFASIHGSMLKSAGYVFAGDDTSSSAEESSSLSADPGADFHIYGFEWKLNNDVVVYVDGVELHTLQGASWNPSDNHVAQELNLIIDTQVDETKDAATVLDMEYVTSIANVHVFEYDCATIGQFTNNKPTKGNANKRGLTGLSDSDYASYVSSNGGSDPCTQGSFGGHCEMPGTRKGMCHNPFPGSAPLTRYADRGACTNINNAAMCGGYLDDKGTHRTAANRLSEAKWESDAGSFGECMWDMSGKRNKNAEQIANFALGPASSEGSCVPTVPPHINLAAYNSYGNREKCGGTNDQTAGYGMYCFARCVRRTEFNEGNTAWFRNFCGGAADPSTGEDVCNSFSKGGEVVQKDGEDRWKTRYFDCQKEHDTSTANKRNKHCYMKYHTASEANDIGAWTNGLPGMYCSSRVPGRQKSNEGGLPLWMLSNFGAEACATGGGYFGCLASNPDGEGKCFVKSKCKPKKFSGTLAGEAASGNEDKFLDSSHCDATDALTRDAAKCALTASSGPKTRRVRGRQL